MNISKLGTYFPDGKIVHVRFIGRTDGLEHDLVGRIGVTTYLAKQGLKFNPYEKGLLPVFSYKRNSKGRFLALDPNNKKGTWYRLIPSEGIIFIRSAGVTYNGNGEQI